MVTQSVFSAERLREWGRGVLAAMGVPEDDARIVAEILVEANLRGVDSHGIFLLTLYSKRMECGLVNPTPTLRYEKTRGGTGILDADTALGPLATLRAMDHAIELAREVGTGTVMVRRCTHFGAGAYYTMHAAKHDMIGVLHTQGDTGVVIFGGKNAYLGTNPISVAIPAGSHEPFVMDMATSEVALGKIKAAAAAGVKEVPSTWGVDAQGDPVTDPAKAVAAQPMSGAKGWALAMMIELFASGLGGSKYGPKLTNKWNNFDDAENISVFVQAIDPTAFGTIDEFKARVDELLSDVKAQPPAPDNPFGRITVAGEPEFETMQKRLREGCPLGEEVVVELRELGERVGVPLGGRGA